MVQMTCCWMLVILVCVCCAAAAADIPRIAPEEFAILPWGTTPGEPEALQGIYDCGFNLAGFMEPQHLDLVQAAGLKAILHGTAVADVEADELDERVRSLVERVSGHPAAFGYYLRDEPQAQAYPLLARWVDAYRRHNPEALAYINLLPNYASPGQLGVPDYETYLEEYVRIVKPAFISYDHYALMNDGTLRGGYYENLEAVRRVALKHGLPFWNIVLSNGHFRYAEPSEAGMRFQAYTTLAAGARGISYFTYFTPKIGNYRLGPIDQFGHRTPTWEMLRSVNLQIHCLAPHLVKLTSIGVFHHPDVPPGCSGMDATRHISRLGEGDYMVGEFEGPDKAPWVMLVNKSLTQSHALDIGFKMQGEVQQVDPYTGGMRAYSGESIWLAPGQGVLLTVKP